MVKAPRRQTPAEGRPRSPALATTKLHGTATTPGEALRSPVTGAVCVHWRLRIHESVAPGMDLVHEVMSPDPLDVAWQPGPSQPARNVRVAAERANIEAQPILHREGSPGALAVARHFGLLGRVRVEEVLVKNGEPIELEGFLFDPSAGGGPYRANAGPTEMMEATVRLSTGGLSIRPAILPWALGTAAALLSAAGVATAVAKLWKFKLDVVPTTSEMGAAKVRRVSWP